MTKFRNYTTLILIVLGYFVYYYLYLKNILHSDINIFWGIPSYMYLLFIIYMLVIAYRGGLKGVKKYKILLILVSIILMLIYLVIIYILLDVPSVDYNIGLSLFIFKRSFQYVVIFISILLFVLSRKNINIFIQVLFIILTLNQILNFVLYTTSVTKIPIKLINNTNNIIQISIDSNYLFNRNLNTSIDKSEILDMKLILGKSSGEIDIYGYNNGELIYSKKLSEIEIKKSNEIEYIFEINQLK